MIRSFPVPTGWRFVFGAVVLAVPLLSGCDSTGYPTDMRYPPRTDPVFRDGSISTEELVHPDRPGQLPILTLLNAEDPENPLYKPFKEDKLLSPLKVDANFRRELQTFLSEKFGTPAKPKADIGDEAVGLLKLEPDRLAQGSKLYRIHCLHCHGLSGDGRGPTAFWVNPHPRDYRQGIFKFVSCNRDQNVQQKPRRADIIRVLRQGIDGTSMPSFVLLTDEEQEAIASYVIHLSLRGQVEYAILQDKLTKETPSYTNEEFLQALTSWWVESQKPPFQPPDPPFPWEPKNEAEEKLIAQAVKEGKEFFSDPKQGNCLSCHTNYGRDSRFRYDAWGTLTRPADLTAGMYRGGRRPLDLYWRVALGINGSAMPGFGIGKPEADQKKVWTIIKFLEVLPYPGMREKYGVKIDG